MENKFEDFKCDRSNGRISRRCCESEWKGNVEYDYLLNVCLDKDYKEVTAHSYEYTTQSMLILPHIPPHLYTYHPFNKYPLIPAW